MESPPVTRYIPQKSKKRVFPGGSPSYVEPEVVEIARPVSWSSKSKSLKQKEVIHHEVIDVDMDEDCGEVMLIDGKINTNNKGKEVVADSLFNPSSAANLGSVDGVQSSMKSSAAEPRSIINLEGTGSNLSYGADDYTDIYFDDFMCDDEYAVLQSYFDKMETPPGVEAPIPWLPGPALNRVKPATASSSTHSTLHIQSDAAGFPTAPELSHSSELPKPTQTREKSIPDNFSSLLTQVQELSCLHKLDTSSSWSLTEPVPSKKKLVASNSSTCPSSQLKKALRNFSSGAEPFKSWRLNDSSHCKRKLSVPSGTTYTSPGQFPSVGGPYFSNSTSKQVGNGIVAYSSFQTFMDAINLPPGVDASMSNRKEFLKNMKKQSYPKFNDPLDALHIFSGEEAHDSLVQDPGKSQNNTTASASLMRSEDEILEKFHVFKKFDTVQDHSDHHYSRSGSSVKQPSKNWAKKIQGEWKILEKDLPDTIFVRVYESRMDLLRAVIVGAEGTPYHDGLFFFDVFFPTNYPNAPPHVWYHSGGLRINPNLYNCGKVCLSLLNTWSGNQQEKWISGVSTMLQVLVSIQGLILNANPFFNEPGFANMAGSAAGEKSSLQYNENTFILSLKTMIYSMRKPPKYFEDFVVGHFYKRAHDILVACKAYMDGAQVGCLVKGGVQDVDEGDKSCSESFKQTLMGLTDTLVKEFAKIGVKDCEKFLSPVQQESQKAAMSLLQLRS